MNEHNKFNHTSHEPARSARAALTVTVEVAAELLGISRGLAYEAIRRGELPSIHIGQRLLVPRVAILKRLGYTDKTSTAAIRARVVRLAEALEDGDLRLAGALARDIETDLAGEELP